MTKPSARTYSRYNRDAAALMGKLIRLGRIERKMTAQDLADRAGISRGLLQRIEKGDLKCAIGTVFEVAAITGIKLFEADGSAMMSHIDRVDDRLALLPKYVRHPVKAVKDDF